MILHEYRQNSRAGTYGSTMGYRPRAIGSAAIIALFIGAGLAQPARAEQYVAHDSRRDIEYYDLLDVGSKPVAVPDHQNGDLTRFTVRYGNKRVWLVLKFRELRRSDPFLGAGAQFFYPTPVQYEYSEVFAVVRAKSPKSKVQFSGDATGCTARHHVNYAENRLRISFPVACFGTPRWLRSNAVAFTSDRTLSAATYMYADRAPGENMHDERWSPRLRQS